MLVIHRYFAKEQAVVVQLESGRDAINGRIEELDEEHGGEDGLLADARNNKGKLTKISVRARLGDIKAETEMADERKVLELYLSLVDDEAAANKALKDAQSALEAKVDGKYRELSVEEIKTLVVDEKWLASLEAAIQEEMDRVSQQLTQRIRELSERYGSSLPQIVSRVTELEATVNGHLKQMGYTW